MKQIGRPLYTISEIYGILVRAFRSMGDFKRGRTSGVLSQQLQERVMLAVTSVNKCAMCSYAHTEMALQAGLSREEIALYLSGDFPSLPPKEAKAILFAQNYADRRGHPSQEAWQGLLDTYGREASAAYLGAVRMIMAGNALGIPTGSLRDRCKGKQPDPRSSLPYELAVLFLLLPMLLLSGVQAALWNLLHISKI